MILKGVTTKDKGTTAYNEKKEVQWFPTENEAVEYRRKFCGEPSNVEEQEEEDE